LFKAQERMLARTLAAAGRLDASSTLSEVNNLRQLARRNNGSLVQLGLTDCTFPSAGFPL
jgi:hypothetical protein